MHTNTDMHNTYITHVCKQNSQIYMYYLHEYVCTIKCTNIIMSAAQSVLYGSVSQTVGRDPKVGRGGLSSGSSTRQSFSGNIYFLSFIFKMNKKYCLPLTTVVGVLH